MKKILVGLKKFYKREDGASAVEFALVLPILTLLVFGIIQFGIIFNYYLSITHAAREGVRWAALEYNGDAVRIKTKDAAPYLNPPLTDEDIRISNENPTIDDQGNPITVWVDYDVPINIPFMDVFFPDSKITLTSSATQRIE